MEDDLDISWILEQDRLDKIEHNCWREPLTQINVATIYMNQHKEIETIEREKMDISGVSILTKEKLIKITQAKRKYTPTSKYILKETLWFHIDLEPENIQHFSEKQDSFLHVYPILEDITLKPSIFIFHKLNTLYFLFHETFIPNTNTSIINSIITPNNNNNNNKNNKTKKKVEIIEPKQGIVSIKTTRKRMT